MLMNMFFSVGILLATALGIRWALLPLIRFIRYLATSRELVRCRDRALGTSALAGLVLLAAVGLVKVPDRCRVEGVVEPSEYAVVHMKTAGFVESVLDSGTRTGPQGPLLMTASSPELETRQAQLTAEYRQLCVHRQAAQIKEAAAAQIMDEKITALEEKMERNRLELVALELRSPISGIWVAPGAERLKATYLDRGERIGIVADLDNLLIRAVASQKVAARLIEERQPNVAIRVQGRPHIEMIGQVQKIIPAGQERLPSASLGFAAGGATQIDIDDPSGTQTVEPFFEIWVVPSIPETTLLRPGQTTVLRFETASRTILAQCWRALLQLFQGRS
jgi:hypothetical protein